MLTRKDGRNEYNNYNSLQEYIEDHSQVVPLSFPSLDYLFRIYFGILALPVAICVAHWLLIFLVQICPDCSVPLRQLINRMVALTKTSDQS